MFNPRLTSVLVFICISCLAANSASCAADTASEAALEEAGRLLRAGSYHDAVAAYRRAVARAQLEAGLADPTTAQALEGLASALRKVAQDKEAAAADTLAGRVRRGDVPANIDGTVEMRVDKSIFVHRRFAIPGKMVGDQFAELKPGQPGYTETVNHVGGLLPGETKPFPAWPDDDEPLQIDRRWRQICSGIEFGKKSMLILQNFEYNFHDARGRQSTSIPNGDVGRSTLYALARALDHAQGYFSHGEEFRKAYFEDATSIPTNERLMLACYIGKGDAPLEDTYAAVWSALRSRESGKPFDAQLLVGFSHVARAIEGQSKRLPPSSAKPSGAVTSTGQPDSSAAEPAKRREAPAMQENRTLTNNQPGPAQTRQGKAPSQQASSEWQAAFEEGRQAKLQSHYPEAGRLLKRAVALAEQFGPGDRRLAESLLLLGGVYLRTSRPGQAEVLYKRALPMFEKLSGRESSDVGILLDNLGQAYDAQEKYTEGEALHLESLGILERVLGPDSLDVAMTLDNLSQVYAQRSQFDKAKQVLQRAIAIEEKRPGAQSHLATALDNLGGIYMQEGKFEDAQRVRDRALKLYEQALGPEHLDTGICLNNLGALSCHQGKYAEAAAYYDRACKIFKDRLGPDNPSFRMALQDKAYVQYLLNRRAQAGATGLEKPEWARLFDRAILARQQGHFAEAAGLYRATSESIKKTLGDKHPVLLSCLEQYWFVLKYLNRTQEAQQVERTMAELGAATGTREDIAAQWGRAEDLTLQATRLLGNGKLAEAEARLNEAIKLNPKFAPAHAMKAVIFERRNDPQKALAELTEAINCDPCSQYYFARGEVRCKLRDYTGSIDDFQQCVKLDRRHQYSKALLMLGASCTELGRCKEAVEWLSQYIAAKPDDPVAYAFRGAAYHKLGNMELARKDAEKAKSLGFKPPK